MYTIPSHDNFLPLTFLFGESIFDLFLSTGSTLMLLMVFLFFSVLSVCCFMHSPGSKAERDQQQHGHHILANKSESATRNGKSMDYLHSSAVHHRTSRENAVPFYMCVVLSSSPLGPTLTLCRGGQANEDISSNCKHFLN